LAGRTGLAIFAAFLAGGFAFTCRRATRDSLLAAGEPDAAVGSAHGIVRVPAHSRGHVVPAARLGAVVLARISGVRSRIPRKIPQMRVPNAIFERRSARQAAAAGSARMSPVASTRRVSSFRPPRAGLSVDGNTAPEMR